LTDFPEMTIATDNVDPEMVEKPRRWDIRSIRNFMLIFGSVSSIFDFLTFGILWFMLRATPDQFRTGWFLEPVISASAIVLVIRTRRPFFKSRPGRYLWMTTLLVGWGTLLLPLTPLAKPMGFEPLSIYYYGIITVIVALYMVGAELSKRFFYRRARF